MRDSLRLTPSETFDMIKRKADPTLLIGVGVIFTLTPVTGRTQDMHADLRQLDHLRNGVNTPFAAVEQMGTELLSKYPNPAEQGRILYQIAHVYAQSGQV